MKMIAVFAAAAVSMTGLASLKTNYVSTGQQVHIGYLHATNHVVATNMSLSDVTGVFGLGGGGSTAAPKAFTMTPSFWRGYDGAREVQMQFFEPTSIKMVNVRLEQSGNDIVARVNTVNKPDPGATAAGYYQWFTKDKDVDAPHYFGPATPGSYDFYGSSDAAHWSTIATTDEMLGYGVHGFGVYSGARAKVTVSEPESGTVYNITDGGTLEMTGTTGFSGYVDGIGELKIGDSSGTPRSCAITELQLNVPQKFEGKANVHDVELVVHSVYGSSVGTDISNITVCNSSFVSPSERLLQVQFLDGKTIKAIMLRLRQDGDGVTVNNYNWKYDKNGECEIGDDATDWSNGGTYLIESATLYAPATHMTVSMTNLSHCAFTVDGSYAKVTSRYTINQGGSVTVRNGGFLDVQFGDEKDRDGGTPNLNGGFGALNSYGFGLIRVLDSSVMQLRGFCIDSKTSLEICGGSVLYLAGSTANDWSTYAPYLKIADGSKVVSRTDVQNDLRMGYVAGCCKLWSAGSACTNVIDSRFRLANNSSNARTVHIIADADLVFKRMLMRDSGADASIYKCGAAAVEIQAENRINGTMYVNEGVLRIANDKGITNSVSLAGGTLEIVSNVTVTAGTLSLSERTLPSAASGGKIVLQPTASLEFESLGEFAEGARLVIEGDLSSSVLKLPALDALRLSVIRVRAGEELKRVRQDDEGRLHLYEPALRVIVR